MECFDIYDKDRQKTGRTKIRGEKLLSGEFRLVVHVCIFNSKGEMLIQQRTETKKGWPGLWDVSVGGGAVAGDSAEEAAMRETKEELGLDIDLHGVRPRVTVNFRNGFNDVFLVEMDVDTDTLVLQPDEVQAVRWATKEEIFGLIDSGDFIPYYKGFVTYLFEALVPHVLFDAER